MLETQYEERLSQVVMDALADGGMQGRGATTGSPSDIKTRGLDDGRSLESANVLERVLKDLPPELDCPITHQPMLDPVLTCDGHTYERYAILHWLSQHDTSPLTGLVVQHKDLQPNVKARDATYCEIRTRARALSALFPSSPIRGKHRPIKVRERSEMTE